MRKERSRCPVGAAVLAVAVALAAGVARGADPLPSFNIDLTQTSVSGLSSGAYMAGQFHVAFSGTVVGEPPRVWMPPSMQAVFGG